MGVADSVQYTLRPKDLDKASDLFGVDRAMLERLNAQRLLDATYIRAILMRADYERLTSGLHFLEHGDKKYKFPEAMAAIRREYNVSKETLARVLRGNNSAILFCRNCGVKISRSTNERTGGLCSNCFADTLEL